MEYIYKFIEYINESNILSIGLIGIIIAYLIYLYMKKGEVENYLGLKLIGFYLLGAFTFNFNSSYLIIPVGFAIYLLFMKNKERSNSIIKKKACIMGLIIVCFGWLNSIIYNKVEYRDREIPIKNISIKTLRADYEIIKKELGIDDVASVGSLDLQYDENNKIRSLSYRVEDLNNKTFYISANNDRYSIITTKTYDSEYDTFMFNTMSYNMDIKTLLDVISNTNFKSYKDASYYTIIYNNEENYHEEDTNLYTIDLGNYSTKKLKSKYPVYDSVDISHMPMKQPSEGSWESTELDIYLLYYNIDESIDE